MTKLDRLTIHGFKSFEALEDFELGQLNVLIGANGSGKSNFVEFFRLLRALAEQRFQKYLKKYGPADGYFFNGVQYTKQIKADLYFGANRYVFYLDPTAEGGILIDKEQTQYLGGGSLFPIAEGQYESALKDRKDDKGAIGHYSPNRYVWKAVSSWQVYHFHDTSMTAGMRRDSGIYQTNRLDPHGDNLAAFLWGLREEYPETYQAIRHTLQRMAPFFDDFELTVRKNKDEDQVRLTWRQKDKDYIFSPSHLSDGTIRFLCLTTALLQPHPPSTIIIDEPELGLHPEALAILAGLVRSASSRMQIIIGTQAPMFLSEFEPEQVITVDQVDGSTQLARLDRQALAEWLQDFSLGELWLKGNVGGGVNYA